MQSVDLVCPLELESVDESTAARILLKEVVSHLDFALGMLLSSLFTLLRVRDRSVVGCWSFVLLLLFLINRLLRCDIKLFFTTFK